MIKQYALQMTGEGFLMVLVASAPPIVISMIVGLMISIFQATTQIQEQTLTFVPKVITVFGTLLMFGSWIMGILMRYALSIMNHFPAVIH